MENVEVLLGGISGLEIDNIKKETKVVFLLYVGYLGSLLIRQLDLYCNILANIDTCVGSRDTILIINLK